MKLKPWVFLSTSILILTCALLASTAFQARQDELRELEQECELQLQQVTEIRDQLSEASDRLADLEEMLLNLQRMEQIVSRSAAPSRGGRRQLTLTTMPLDTPSGYSAARFERALKGTSLAGIGEALVLAEAETGINAVILAAICAHESGWGTSRLARDKGNLAGLGAYDGQGYSAGIRFDSRTASIMFLAHLLAVKYAPGGKYYGGSHDLQGIGVRYASDPGWARKVAACMRVIVEVAHVIH
jgi:beta-N-acetylglucosaminidase